VRDTPETSFPLLKTSQAAFAAIAISIALTAPPTLAQGRSSGEGCSECFAYLEYPPSDPSFMLPSSGHENGPSPTWPTDPSSPIKQ
jgi:hypothetical protein